MHISAWYLQVWIRGALCTYSFLCGTLKSGWSIAFTCYAKSTCLGDLVRVIEDDHEVSDTYVVNFASGLAPSLIRAHNLMHLAQLPHCSSETTGRRKTENKHPSTAHFVKARWREGRKRADRCHPDLQIPYPTCLLSRHYYVVFVWCMCSVLEDAYHAAVHVKPSRLAHTT